MLKCIEVSGGFDKAGRPEALQSLLLETGHVYTIVGRTGSGKTQLAEDIESLNNGEGVTRRIIRIDGQIPGEAFRRACRSRLIAHLSQNMNFILDMPVLQFLTLRQRLTGSGPEREAAEKTLETANGLAGEAIHPLQPLTKLSGGQSRALMIADIALNNEAPVILIDEVENAGIDRVKALSLLAKRDRIVLMITHDPLLALYGHRRIVLENGGLSRILDRTAEEVKMLKRLTALYDDMEYLRRLIRSGENLKGVIPLGI